jgi:hypothetical protein
LCDVDLNSFEFVSKKMGIGLLFWENNENDNIVDILQDY